MVYSLQRLADQAYREEVRSSLCVELSLSKAAQPKHTLAMLTYKSMISACKMLSWPSACIKEWICMPPGMLFSRRTDRSSHLPFRVDKSNACCSGVCMLHIQSMKAAVCCTAGGYGSATRPITHHSWPLCLAASVG